MGSMPNDNVRKGVTERLSIIPRKSAMLPSPVASTLSFLGNHVTASFETLFITNGCPIATPAWKSKSIVKSWEKILNTEKTAMKRTPIPTLIDPLSNCIHAVRYSALQLDRVLIVGAGPIGLLMLQCVRHAGASAVYVSQVSDKRRNMAEKLGATAAYDPSKENLYVKMDEVTGGRGPDVLFQCAGTPHTLREAVMLVRKGGRVFVISICEEPVEADFMTPVLNELDIKGSYRGHEEYPYAIDFIAKKLVDVKSLIFDVIPLDQLVEKGFEALAKPLTEAVKIKAKISWGSRRRFS